LLAHASASLPRPTLRPSGRRRPRRRAQIRPHRRPGAQRQRNDRALGSEDECTGDLPPLREGAVVRELTICNKKGLHARASARFVQTVEKFDADVKVRRGQEVVGGTSIMGLMMLGAGPGTTITVEAIGRDANQVIEALAALVSGRFTERD